MGEAAPRTVPRRDSGVTCAELVLILWFRRCILSGVGLEGDASFEDTDSEPARIKLFISVNSQLE